MTLISFYHPQKHLLDQAVFTLLHKSYRAGKRALVLIETKDRLQYIDTMLWSYDANSWLPHGSDGGEDCVEHPILLSTEDINRNEAQYLFLLDGMRSSKIKDYDRCFELYNESLGLSAEQAWETLRTFVNSENEISYWFQNKSGSWEKKY